MSCGVCPNFKNNSTFFIPTAQAITTGVSTVANFTGVNFNPFGLVSTAGTFTGLYGAFVIYTQVLVAAATLTAGTLQIVKNGAVVLAMSFPALFGGFSACNAETVVSMLPADTIAVSVFLTGTTITLSPGGSSILVISPA